LIRNPLDFFTPSRRRLSGVPMGPENSWTMKEKSADDEEKD
jgi:hypothetical protein